MSRFAAAAAAVWCLLYMPAALARPTPDGFSGLVERLSPAVVNIATDRTVSASARDEDVARQPTSTGAGAPESRAVGDIGTKRARSLGSGFVIEASGLIVTNNHVVEGAQEIYVGFQDGSRLSAVIAGRDAKTDIALLRVRPRKPLAAVSFGNSDEAKAGDWVLAIGNPFGLGGSVTAGIISARNRQLDAELYDNFIQTDAAINRGNSGGPLFDMEGHVVGLNSSLMSPSGGSIGIGFAIPSNTAKTIVAQLRQFGQVRRGWIGANVQDLTDDLAEGLSLSDARGALITHVTAQGPAVKAGLEPGDVVLRIDGKDVVDSRVMQQIVVEAQSGRVLNLQVMRKGRLMSGMVRVARRQEGAVASAASSATGNGSRPAGVGGLGFNVSPLTADMRLKHRIPPGVEGVAVTSVFPGLAAAENGIAQGDIIVEAGREPVGSQQQLNAKVAAMRAAGRGVVLLTLNRGGELSFAALRLPQQSVEKTLKTAGR
ncbi:MAG: Do family serine endopeptidase [Alphaproteobacteria bacterium]|nr:Do family serine endopeptidase [Alphaproteobacteria bacterium]